MPRRRSSEEVYEFPPSMTPEGRENELVSLAMDLAEKQLRNGTASAQVITHFLKLGSSREHLEQDYLIARTDITAAKQQAIESAQHTEKLYADAIAAMKRYRGDEIDEEL